MGNINVSGNGKENSIRKKVLKKAAMLATVASITGACAVGGQKPKESEALIGAIIMAIVSVVSVGASIGQSVYETESAKNMQKQAIEEQRRQEEEARKQAEREAEEARKREEEERRREEEARKQAEREAEEARIRAALEDPEYNVRLQEQEKEEGKIIDMSSADNSLVLEEQQQEAMARARRRNSIRRPVAPPKDVNVGGFGVDDEEEVEENVISEVLEQELNEEDINEEIIDVEEEVNGDIIDIGEESYEVSDAEEEDYEEESYEEFGASNSGSNIVKLNLKDYDFGGDDYLQEKTVARVVSLVSGQNQDDYVEVDEDMLMSDNEAQNHRLVKEGFLSAEEIILLDFGIRNGTINESVINSMYEIGEISDEYYEGAMELLFEIYEELSE